jgi:hypothetical protein
MGGRQIRVGAVIAAALVLALVAWIVLDDGDDRDRARRGSQAAAATPRLDERALVERARRLGTRPYWVGPLGRSGYELTTTPAGRTFVRYLPAGVEPGDRRPDFLTVATYPLGASATAALRRAGRERGARSVRLPGGALMVTDVANPRSAFYARPGWTFEVEVYHPTPGEATRLVLSEAVKEIR